MADILKLVDLNKDHPMYERSVVEDGDWHAFIGLGGDLRTVCGIQLDGDDGYGPGPVHKGPVTCDHCRTVIVQIKKMRNWR